MILNTTLILIGLVLGHIMWNAQNPMGMALGFVLILAGVIGDYDV